MIFITGDVHMRIENYWEQKIAGQDLDNSIKYLEILKKYNLPATLFINGICFKENPNKIKKLLEYDIELGGHTYNNFGSMGPIKGFIFRKLWKCIYGPKFYQKRDIIKTKKEFEKFNLKMLSWRTHSFGSNKETFKILAKNEVKFVSDLIGDIRPFKEDLIHVPINIPVDVVTIAYGILRPENRDPFASCTKGRIETQEWFEIVKKRISKNEKNNIDSVLLLHPTTMEVMDKMKTFEKIAKFISKYSSGKISEIKIPKYQ